MSDPREDFLLRRLGRHAAERERADRELEAAARTEPAAADRPLDAEARGRIVARLEQVVSAERGPARRTPASVLAWPLAAMLLATVSILVFRATIGDADSAGGRPPATLPGYTIRVEGATRTERGDGAPERPLALAPGNRLQVVLTPREPVAGTVAARAYLARGGGWQAMDGGARLAVSDQGAVRLDAILGSELEIAAGTARLLLMVGDPRALPTAEAAAAASAPTGRASGPGWHAFSLALEIREPPA